MRPVSKLIDNKLVKHFQVIEKRVMWDLNFKSYIIFTLFFTASVYPRKWAFNDQPSQASNPVQPCPSMCDCSRSGHSSLFPSSNTVIGPTTQTNQSPSTPESILARCWVASNLVHLQCTPEWTILHLQILNGIMDTRKSSPGKLRGHDIDSNDSDDDDEDNPTETGMDVQPLNSLFTHCSSLTRLAIWEKSQINTISRHLFQPLANLIRLIIQAPRLQSLPNHFLIFTPKLNFIMISKCAELKQFSPNVFEPCPKDLRTIWLNNNALNGRLHAGLFRQCNLHTLWLNDNELELIDSGSLTGLENLINLRLDHNALKHSLEQALGITSNSNLSALIETPNLKIIDLSYNQLESIDSYQWSGLCIYHDTIHMGLCKLEELKLSYNQLRFISPRAFLGLPKLQKLDLEGNSKLYNTESITSLTVALHSLTFVNLYLQRLTLSIPIKTNFDLHFHTLDICNSNSNLILENSMDLALKQVLIQLNQTKCHKKVKNQVTQSLAFESDQFNQTKNCDSQNDDENSYPGDEATHKKKSTNEQDSIIAYIRRANRLMLSLICIGILFTGGILTTCLFALIHCLIKTNYFDSFCRLNRSRPLSITEDQIEPLITSPTTLPNSNLLNHHHHHPLHHHHHHNHDHSSLPHENYFNSSSFFNYSLKKIQPRTSIDLPPTPTSTPSTTINHLQHQQQQQREDYSSRYCIPILFGPYGSRMDMLSHTNSNGVQRIPPLVTLATSTASTTTAPTSPTTPQSLITAAAARRNNSTSNMYARPQTILGLNALNRHVKCQQSNKQCNTDPMREANSILVAAAAAAAAASQTTTTTATANGSSYSLTTNQSNQNNLNREPQQLGGKFKQIRG